MSGFEGALCVGRHDLFDSTEPRAHAEASKLCAECPALMACRVAFRTEQKRTSGASTSPVGTWAGRLAGARRAISEREHGTEKGYQQHRTYREKACDKCLEAHRFAYWLKDRYGVKAS